MTYQEFWAKYIELKAKVDDDLRDRAKKLFDSGAIDLEAFDDDYQLPKAVLTDALLNEASQFMPFTRQGKRLVKNFGRF